MSLYSWITKRGNGMKNVCGGTDKIHKSIYSSIEVQSYKTYSGGDYGGVFNLEFSGDGSLLVAACEKKAIVLFDPNTAKQICAITDAHEDCVNCVKFLDDRMFATCSDDSTIAIWDTRNLKSKIRTLHGHSNWVKNIEFSTKDCLLITSGFDGAIYTWDINSYTEQGFVYQKVFHTPGLMRCRLSPDLSRLVICTTGGYLIIIHNLDLSTLADDLKGFKPNVYRLMQLRGQYLPNAAKYDYVISNKQKVNRVELVSDFPRGNDAEVISSLHIHPQNWCALSRNRSYDESSEWTCVHDIQEIERENNKEYSDEDIFNSVSDEYDSSSSDELGIYTDSSNSSAPATQTERPGIQIRLNPSRIRNNYSQPGTPAVNPSPSREPPEVNRGPERPSPDNAETAGNARINLDIWAAEITIRNRNQVEELVNTRAYHSTHVYGVHSGLNPPTERQTQLITPQEISAISYYKKKKRNYQNQNLDRLLHYIQEPSMGKGFIKELCFSSDGRIICSPYDYGIRLLAFNEDCKELPFAINHNNITSRKNESSVGSGEHKYNDTPRTLYEIKRTECHADIVVSTKFSSRHPLLVSGCLRGRIVWHQPVL